MDCIREILQKLAQGDVSGTSLRVQVESDVKTQENVNEGVYDPSIFKAIFLAGGPGSGKSYVAKRVTGGHGLKLVNSDPAFEKLLKEAGEDLKNFDTGSDKVKGIRGRAKEITAAAKSGYVAGRLGLVIDGTGKDYGKIKEAREKLFKIGYDCYMIFVNTSIETALERNANRSRTLPDKMVKKFWDQVQKNMGKFQDLFGASNYVLVDNNDAGEDVFKKVWVRVMKLVKSPIKNPIAKKWIAGELAAKNKQKRG